MTADTNKANLSRFMLLMMQLGLLMIIFRQFQIVSGSFLRISLLAFAGFGVHYFLPVRYRLPFFLLLSILGIGLIFGVVNGIWLISIGLVLIGICHLPFPFYSRICLLVSVVSVLAILRSGWLEAPWSQAIWPILGSMFMFRLIIYLYDLRFNNAPAGVWRSLAYFFLLPNVCFPLFPVVDYEKFHHNYYNDQRHRIYQTGVDWMVRGITHLILYRFIYQYATIGPSEINNIGDLVQYLLTTFLLYLRVSGQFHLVVGMLHLFGFNLPETNKYYLLASSFTDFWRRINIYWKDFMMKIFYYPIYFRLRKLGNTQAIVFSTFIVFIITWFLHSYQWFWLQGSFPVIWQDAVYWTILAVLVAINSLYEIKYGRKRSIKGKASWTLQEAVSKIMQIAVTLSIICILWSLWSSETVNSWLSLWTPLGSWSSTDSGMMSFMFVASFALGGSSAGGKKNLGNEKNRKNPFSRATWASIFWLPVLSLIGIPAIYTQFSPDTATFIHTLRSNSLSKHDVEKLERGYYEDLHRVNRFNTPLWEVYMNKPVKWLDVQGSGLKRFTGDFLQYEMVPSYKATSSFSTMSTNQWGMRDKNYTKLPADDTFRIVLIGSSMTLGWGVEDNETYETLVEEWLNRDKAGDTYKNFEILNFAVAGYYPLQKAAVIEKAIQFSPDAVYYVATGNEFYRSKVYLAEVIRNNIDIPYQELREIANQAGVTPEMEEVEALNRLDPFKKELLAWVYHHIAQYAAEQSVPVVWIFVPQLTEGKWRKETEPAQKLAEEYGFYTLDLSDVYKNKDVSQLTLAEWDKHPNAKGHRLIAESLYRAIQDNEALLSPHLSVQPNHSTIQNNTQQQLEEEN